MLEKEGKEYDIMTWQRLRTALAGGLLFLLCAMPALAADAGLVVGGKNFTEQYLLAEMAGQLLEKAGHDVTVKTGVGSVVARKSLENSQFDLYYEYTGTAYTVYHKQKDRAVMTDPKAVYDWVKKADARQGLVWLDPVMFNNTYTLMMRKKHAAEEGIHSISDLAAHLRKHPDVFVVALEAEFWERPDGFKKVMQVYDFRVARSKVKKMSLGLTYKALKEKQVDVAMGFATDGRIAAFGFVNLDDDRKFFPVYNPAPVVRAEVLERCPRLPDILRPLTKKLDTVQMQRLNALVDIEHRDVKEVARQWLVQQGLL
jgi:osmoprotectant transport system substrate-binding protein